LQNKRGKGVPVLNSKLPNLGRGAGAVAGRESRQCFAGMADRILDSYGFKQEENLLEAFHQIEVCEGSMEAVDVGLAVWGYHDRSDGGDAGGINWNNLLPERFLSGG